MKTIISYKLRVTSLIVSLFLACHLSLTTYHYCYAQSENNNYVRVLILRDVKAFDVFVKGKYEIRSPDGRNVLKEGRGLNAKVYVDNNAINISPIRINEKKIIIFPESGVFYLNNRPLRGALIIRKENDLTLSAINYLALEDYVKGVLFHEVSHHWPIEALCAQAIATRTYALYQVEASRTRDYDVTSDIYSQVYGGKNAERFRTNRAAEKTKGLIMTYRGKIFPAYFHSVCGGKTEDANELWQINLACLKSVECNYCVSSPHFKWQKILSKSEITEKLNTAGFKLDSLDDIQILERDNSGRVSRLKLKSGDKELTVSAKDFRQAIGPRDIRSTNFMVSINDSQARFEGLGWGHGVGLCQWGAYFMSVKKYKFDAILKYYYPGVKIEDYESF